MRSLTIEGVTLGTVGELMEGAFNAEHPDAGEEERRQNAASIAMAGTAMGCLASEGRDGTFKVTAHVHANGDDLPSAGDRITITIERTE